ncbi:hypothetical protein LAY41_01525 [Argonema galeatum A003/A1]|nr:hypothetical protein [Argonema galeatum A003/A1]
MQKYQALTDLLWHPNASFNKLEELRQVISLKNRGLQTGLIDIYYISKGLTTCQLHNFTKTSYISADFPAFVKFRRRYNTVFILLSEGWL